MRSSCNTVFWLVVLLCCAAPRTSEGLRFHPVSGYAKQYVTLVDSPLRPGGDALLTGRFRLNSGARHGRFDLQIGLELVPRLLSSPDALDSGLPQPQGTGYRLLDIRHRLLPRQGPGQLELFQSVERLALSVAFAQGDVTIGRQALTFGEARAISSVDVLTPLTWQTIDKQERLGVDALRLRWSAGHLSEVDVGWVFADDARLNASAAYARLRLHLAGAEVTPVAIWFQRHRLLGLSLARDLLRAHTYLEVTHVLADEGDDYTRWSVGSQQSLRPQLNCLIEYHHNGAGRVDIHVEAGPPHASAYREGGVYLLARDYLMPSLTWQMTALSTTTLQALVNLHDGSWLAGPRVEFNLRDDLVAEAGLYKGFAALPSVARQQDPEFVLYGRTFFADIRRYF